MAWRLYDSTGLLKTQVVSLSNQVTDNDGYLAANSATKVPTQAAVKAALSLLILWGSNLWSGNNSYTGTGDFSNGDFLIPSGTGVLDEMFLNWNTTSKQITVGDSVRARAINPIGFLPYALGYGINLGNGFTTTTISLPANGGSIMIPILLQAPMILASVSWWSTDTTLARTAGWDLYIQDQQTPVSGENTLRRVAQCTSNETFTAAAASYRTVACSDTYLGPGVYWLVVQNRHASNAYGFGALAATAAGLRPTSSNPIAKTKTTTNPNGATLDAVAATWTGNANVAGAVLNGKVFGQSSIY